MKDPLIGQQLANFTVERLLGQGGMASVYLGQDVKLHRAVAIKVIERKYRSNPEFSKRFINEARLMAKWRHENIIQIYYADEEKDVSYYVMEYVDGQDLASIMDVYAEGRELMPIADVLRIGNAIASALDYAHRQGVIHRDIKPSNILISKNGRVLLGDFGMALEVRDGSMGSIFGTPHYISPEQARRSADAVPQSDLYSLGIILYEVLTGSVPFDDPSPASVALQHISAPPPAPRSVNPQITAAVEAVLLKALEKNPQNRYQSGAKLMSALDEAFKGTGSMPKIPLPPLPVGAPTIRRSDQSISSIAKREAPKKKPLVEPMPPTVRAGTQPRKKFPWAWLLFFLLVGSGAWFASQSGLFPQTTSAPATFTQPAPASTSTPTPVPPTETLIPPTATLRVLPTNTAPVESTSTVVITATFAPLESTATPTTTSQPENTATSVPVFTQPVSAIPTVKYPNGLHFTLFYNETSFFMLNRARNPRSMSAFVFERLDAQGNPTDTFYGAQWENKNFVYLNGYLCTSIKLFGDQDPPYLNPTECSRGFASIVQPRPDEDRTQIFWNAKPDGSTQFRVLFVKEEVARCEIQAGVCEVYVP